MNGTAVPRPASIASIALRTAAAAGIGALVILIALPVAALIRRAPVSSLFGALAQPVVRDALRLSLTTTIIATAVIVVLGLPVAWVLARGRFPAKGALEVLVQLPMVLPPTVAGLALLLAFGRAGVAGQALRTLGLELPFTTLAVIVAQVFMAAPFFITTSAAGFRAVDQRFIDAAAAHRASPTYTFLRVTLPLALPSVIAGAAMSWARALGEFGATITFAGSLQGKTQTMPIAVYLELQSNLDAAIALSVILVVVSVVLLVAVRNISSAWDRGALVTARAASDAR